MGNRVKKRCTITPGIRCFSLGLLFTVQSIKTLVAQQKVFMDTLRPQLFTVANITEPNGNLKYYEITFFQSARFYKLFPANKNCIKALGVLNYSKKYNKPVLVFLTKNFGDTIGEVRKKDP